MAPRRKRNLSAASTSHPTRSTRRIQIPDQLPGFYYDPEKKRYFRLLPQHNGIHPLSQKTTPKEIEKMPIKESTFLSLIKLRQQLDMGQTSNLSYSSQVTNSRYANLKLVHRQTDAEPLGCRLTAKERCLFLVPWPKQNCIIGVCNDGLESRCKVKAWTVTAKNNWADDENPDCKINITPHDEPLWYVSGKITEVCVGEMVEDNPFLFICSVQTRIRPVPNTHLVVLPLKTVFGEEHCSSPFRVELFKFQSNSVWSCCSSKQSQGIIVGMENQLVSFNYAGTIMNTIPIPEQNVLGLNCEASGRLVRATTSKGFLNGYDFRCNVKTKPVYSIKLGVPTYQMETLSRDDLLLLSGYQNFLCSYDLRMRRPVVKFAHHDNEYARIKACVDESENLLSSAGQKGVVRLWNLHSGKLLNELTLDEPYESNDFASTWFKGDSCMRAQITVTGKKIFVYQ